MYSFLILEDGRKQVVEDKSSKFDLNSMEIRENETFFLFAFLINNFLNK
jgi:hypothetical protein